MPPCINYFKESRIASIEMLFHFFKAVPSSYYIEKEEKLEDNTIHVIKQNSQTFKKELDKAITGFDYVEISGQYLCAYDQKILRAILQALQKQNEAPFIAISAKSPNEEYLPIERQVYSNQATLSLSNFYTLLNNQSHNRSSNDIFGKIFKSLQRLASTTLSFYTKNKSKIITAPLLIYAKNEAMLTFQVHPCVMSFNFQTRNEQNLLKYKQPYYQIDNTHYFKERSDLEQLLYTKIQYKFASMAHKSFTMGFNELREQLFLPSTSQRTQYNQYSKLRNAIKNLNDTSEYTLSLENTTTPTLLVSKK